MIYLQAQPFATQGSRVARKILVADDEEAVRALVTAVLSTAERFNLFVARDGEEALTIAREQQPDLVILDILMPKQDGLAVCKALKEDHTTAHIKIMMLTALSQESVYQKAHDAGADGYVTKPFSPAALLEKVENLLT